MLPRRQITLALALGLLGACATIGPAYPPRPPASPAAPLADPAPSRVAVHVAMSEAALATEIDRALPPVGQGTYPLLGATRHYTWKRDALRVRLGGGRVTVEVHVAAQAELPVAYANLGFDVRVTAEPVVGADWIARLQSPEVSVTSNDRLARLADATAGVLGKIRGELQARVEAFAWDLGPVVREAGARVAEPVDLPLGEAHACARLGLLGVEAGPTVIAGGLEKDLAFVVAPSITLPCAPADAAQGEPRLANVPVVTPGPFTVELPVAARYDELTRAMQAAFADGKLFFSKDYPALWLEQPEVFPSDGKVVVGVRIRGPLTKAGITEELDGTVYLAGHPVVQDDELRVPDLEPTIETSSFFLRLKGALDGGGIRDQARAALRLDLAQRFAAVKDKLARRLPLADGRACLDARLHRAHVTSVEPHADYLRVRVALTASAEVEVPCRPDPAAPSP